MATINGKPGSEKQNFRSIEEDNWSGIYLPAICAGVVMTIVLLMAVSCSKKSDNPTAKISAPTAPAVENPAPVSAATAATPAVPKKVVRKARPANATYVNGTYGVSFSYPRKYSLQAGNKQKPMSVEAGFSKPGAVQIASVDMPDGGYPETDFSSALLSVSVNQDLTAEECAQFAGTSPDAAKTPADSAKTSTDSTKPATLKLGSNEFSELEQMKNAGDKHSDLKYFHLFKNGACYEFALDVETSRQGDEELAQVDRGEVFKHLEKILKTARIKEVELPGVEKMEQAGTSDTKAAPVAATPTAISTQTEKAQVLTPDKPEQK